MEQIVLLPEDDIYDEPLARVIGRSGGLDKIVAINGRFIVTKIAGGSYFSGQGQPQRYARVQFEVWQVIDEDFKRDRATQQVIHARRCVSFDKSS